MSAGLTNGTLISGPATIGFKMTLLVPYTVGACLKDSIQAAEDKFVSLVGGGRVRVVEKGGDVLAHLLTRNDPWASKRTCGDHKCDTCRSRMWLKEEKKNAKKSGVPLPEALLQKKSTQCRREGTNYSLQCLDCALGGVRAVYWGESGTSSRQRHATLKAEVERGLASNPMVNDSIEVHGGTKPTYLSLISSIEPRLMYRAVREAVQIGQQPPGPSNLNRCMEWGAPRVPILTTVGKVDLRLPPPIQS